MKIGLITIHFKPNYGAVLQTYATQKYLSNFGEVKIIDYHYDDIKIVKKNLISKICTKIFHPFNYMCIRKKIRAYNNFRKKFFKLSEFKYLGDNSIKNNPPKYDVYIVGSDQVWNTSITNNSSAYFLNFTNNSNKYSFASSIGHSNMTEEEKKLAKQYLHLFKQISVREQESATELHKLLNIPIQTVLDPIFLLTKEEWLSIAKPINLPKGDFVVIYFMQKNNALNLAIEHAKSLKLPIVCIGKKLNLADKNVLYAGPREFLYVLSKTKYVITNSFHGFAFSLIFGKKIFVCEHTTRNLRLINLLEQINCTEKQITSTTKNILECEIDGKENYDKLQIQCGRDYIKNIFSKYK